MVGAGVRLSLELPVLDGIYEVLGEVGMQFVSLLREAGFMGQVEGLRLFVFVCEHDDHAEVGEVIGHVFPFVDGLLICGVDGESNRAQSVKIEPWRCGFLCWLPGLAGLVFVDPLPLSHLILHLFPT